MLDALWFLVQLVFTVGFLIVFSVVGFATAIAAAVTSIIAFPLSLLVSLLFGIPFIDTLAWTWSLLTVGALTVAAAIATLRRTRGQSTFGPWTRFSGRRSNAA